MNVRTLELLDIKLRRYVARLSEERLETEESYRFIWEAMRYDMPEDIQFTQLQDVFTLLTIPNVGVYDLTTMCSPDEPETKLVDMYETLEQPAKLNGNCLCWEDSPFNFARNGEFKKSTLPGIGQPGTYNFQLEKPITPGIIKMLYKRQSGHYTIYNDSIQHRNLGIMTSCFAPNPEDKIYVKYVDGTIEANLNTIIPTGINLEVHYKTYKTGKPTKIYFDERRIHLSPVPDDVYFIEIAARKNALRLLKESDSPEIDKWGDYIALQAARRVFRESWNFDAINEMLGEWERECLQNIYRHDQNVKQKYNSSDTYNRSSCPSSCTDSCCYESGWPNPFNRGCC